MTLPLLYWKKKMGVWKSPFYSICLSLKSIIGFNFGTGIRVCPGRVYRDHLFACEKPRIMSCYSLLFLLPCRLILPTASAIPDNGRRSCLKLKVFVRPTSKFIRTSFRGSLHCACFILWSGSQRYNFFFFGYGLLLNLVWYPFFVDPHPCFSFHRIFFLIVLHDAFRFVYESTQHLLTCCFLDCCTCTADGNNAGMWIRAIDCKTISTSIKGNNREKEKKKEMGVWRCLH